MLLITADLFPSKAMASANFASNLPQKSTLDGHAWQAQPSNYPAWVLGFRVRV